MQNRIIGKISSIMASGLHLSCLLVKHTQNVVGSIFKPGAANISLKVTDLGFVLSCVSLYSNL